MADASWYDTDFYAVLGVAKTATDKEITKAYRALAKKLHPDTNPSGADKFKSVAAAYEVLGDFDSRAEYDALRTAPPTPPRQGPGPSNFAQSGFAPGGFNSPGFTSGGFNPADFSDVFSSFRSPRSARGADLTASITLPLRDAVRGTTQQLRLDRQVPCSVCHSQGEIDGALCHQCAGYGYVEDSSTVSVRIPPGVDDQQRIKIPGKGQAHLGAGPPGDLYVVVTVAPDRVFTREGKHLTTTVHIDAIAAMLGTEVKVPTLDDPVVVKVAPGTQPGATLRVRGRGVPTGHTHGDLLVKVAVTIPRHLTEHQQELLRQLSEEVPSSPRSSS